MTKKSWTPTDDSVATELSLRESVRSIAKIKQNFSPCQSTLSSIELDFLDWFSNSVYLNSKKPKVTLNQELSEQPTDDR